MATSAFRRKRRPLRILIVDDDCNVLDSMSDAVHAWRCIPLQASSGREALNILSHRRVDLVLCDVAMPGMDGVETLREMRKRVPTVPIIMMGTRVTPDLRRRLYGIGAQSCLAKPKGQKELALTLFPWCFPAAPGP